jgi:predicted DNA-binding transcriptional regulator AlpA
MQPRLIRLRDAPKYLGMDRNRFNNEVRPFLITLKIGQQGIAFDRLDLDQWADEFKKHKGQHAQQTMHWQGHGTKILQRGKKITDKEFQQLVDHLSIRKSCITLP